MALCTAVLAVVVGVAGVKAATSSSNSDDGSPDTTSQTTTHTILPTQTHPQAPTPTYTTPAPAPTNTWTYSPTPTPTAIAEACAGLLSVMNDLDKIMDEAEANMFVLEQQGTSHAMIDHAIQQNIWNRAHASFVEAHTTYRQYDCRPIVVDTRG